MKTSLDNPPRRRRTAPPGQPANLADDDMPQRGPEDSPPPVPRRRSQESAIAARLARLPLNARDRKTAGIYRRRNKEVNRPYWVVIWDKAFWLPCESVVEANSPEQAGAKAVKIANAENGYGPDEDGGFIPVVANERAKLLRVLADMDKHESSRCR